MVIIESTATSSSPFRNRLGSERKRRRKSHVQHLIPRSAGSIADNASRDDYRWLTTSEAVPFLDLATASNDPLHGATALRRGLSPERARLVAEQAALRRRARAKFSLADRMFFTARGLEQATGDVVARHKAMRFPSGQSIFDLCSGIGGDLAALTVCGPTTGFDRDPVLAILAEANGRVAREESPTRDESFSPPRVSVCEASEVDVAACAAWHIDPDRRPAGRRTTRVELHDPGPDTIERLLKGNSHAAIKLAPAARLPDAWHERCELEWISQARECRQLVAWFGSLAHDMGRRRATILSGQRTGARSIVGAAHDEAPPIGEVDRYLFEPDSAVLAAGLTTALAREHGLSAIAPRMAYLTGPRPICDRALSSFEVVEVLPFRLRALAALLRGLDVGPLEIKKRGVDVDPERLRASLKLRGSSPATLLLTTINRRVTAIVARRVEST
jgi:hypothetical protein